MTCGAIIVETRPLPNLVQIIDAHRVHTPPYWGLRIYCGPDNAAVLEAAFPGQVVEIESLTSIRDYNALLTSADFWRLVPFENVLVFQHDSLLLRDGVEAFVGYDWVGAPWPEPLDGGNGGLSLRTRWFMLYAISDEPWRGDVNEDIYFCRQAKKLGARLAPREVCSAFSCERIFRLGTIGCHAIERWLSPEQVAEILSCTS